MYINKIANYNYAIASKDQNPIALPMILPTDRQREFMKNREWERAEMEGRPMSREEIAEKSGYGEAQRVLGAIK